MKKGSFLLTLVAAAVISVSGGLGEASTALAAQVNSTTKDYQNHPNKAEIEYVIKNKLMWLFPDGNFRPDQVITQADLVVGLTNVKGLSVGLPIQEIPANHWARVYYERAKKDGMLNGIPINPSKILSREETAQIIVNAWQNVRASVTQKNDELFKNTPYAQFVVGSKQMKQKAGKFPNGVSTSLYDSVGSVSRADLAYSLLVLKKDIMEVREAEVIANHMHNGITISGGSITLKVPKTTGVIEAKFYIVTKSGEYLDTLQTGYLKHPLADTQRILISIRNKETNIGLVSYRYSKLPNLDRERIWW